ncbi:3,4-dihydroxy-2-butanone-4-phosphate synthase [Ammoniphilus sp. 3BR4]|uniref:3,4-dihydroxy-2-butanone-4-phosphate synthase n=1 Tax=Ammoniphilus sp. 3BR4 TaxID=3158265 RepID=UPI00346538F4
MITDTVERGLRFLKDGELIILFDNIKTGSGILVGSAKHVTPHKVNLMTKIGKGLVSVCIREEKAKKLELPFMAAPSQDSNVKPFTLSVDYKTNTTGISAYERADTIRAIADEDSRPEDFRKPGHLFPLVGKNNGVLQRMDIVEAVLDLSQMTSAVPVGYICEILNQEGGVASETEIQMISEENGIPLLNLSDVADMRKSETLGSLMGTVIFGNQIGRKIGFPTANLDIHSEKPDLLHGVYGVKVHYNQKPYIGIMNVGVRPTIQQEETQVHYEVHIFDFDEMIYGESLQVEVCFFVREEMSFSGLEELIQQINRDVGFVKLRLEKTDPFNNRSLLMEGAV